MDWFFAQLPTAPLSVETILSLGSASMTAYFWLVKARQERPRLRIFQLGGFRATVRRGSTDQNSKSLGLTQLDDTGVLIANDSTRQNSIVRFDCFLKHQGSWLKGRWGYVNDDKPPWNIPPESAISMNMACFFDVPEDYETPQNAEFRVEFVTVSGQRFPHRFWMQAPEM